MTKENFLIQLQEEAKFQAQLENKKYLPQKFDFLASLIIRFSWQFITVISFISALFWNLYK